MPTDTNPEMPSVIQKATLVQGRYNTGTRLATGRHS
jgi:hypothetical protein